MPSINKQRGKKEANSGSGKKRRKRETCSKIMVFHISEENLKVILFLLSWSNGSICVWQSGFFAHTLSLCTLSRPKKTLTLHMHSEWFFFSVVWSCLCPANEASLSFPSTFFLLSIFLCSSSHHGNVQNELIFWDFPREYQKKQR